MDNCPNIIFQAKELLAGWEAFLLQSLTALLSPPSDHTYSELCGSIQDRRFTQKKLAWFSHRWPLRILGAKG